MPAHTGGAEVSVRVRLHPYFRRFTDGQDAVEAVGQTIGECIDDLGSRFPGIKERLCDEKGELLSFYDIYVNSQSCYPEELAKPLKDGDELTIVTIIAGG